MFRTRATRWISFLGFGIFLGFTIAVIVNAAIVVAVDSVPEDIAKEGDLTSTYAVVLIVTASLLATAPLIEWWYNYLSRRFRMNWTDESGGEVESSDEKD